MSSTYFTDSVSDLCQGIIDKVDTYEKRIKYLEEENKKLKDEHYKDSEMQRMEAELKKAKEDLYRGFPISEKEQEKIREWELTPAAKNLKRPRYAPANWQTFPLLRFRYKKQKPKPVILRRINRFFYSFVNGLL